MISADCIRINALGVMPKGFGYEEMKTAALPHPVVMMMVLCLLNNATQEELKAGGIIVQWIAVERR